MASGTAYSFSLPLLKPIFQLDDVSTSNITDSDASGDSKVFGQICHLPKHGSVSQRRTSFIPQSVLVGSLLEHFCSLHEPDEEKSKELFLLICEYLEKFKVISPVSYREEYASIRSQYKLSFYSLIQAIKLDIDLKHPRSLPPNNVVQSVSKNGVKTSVNQVIGLRISRYQEEFEELCELGKGAFGKVYKVRNKIDQQVYAIKKIHFKDTDLENNPSQVNKILREVKSLASLQHANVVGYNHAWMEHDNINFTDKSESDESLSFSDKKVSDESSSRAVFSHENAPSSSSNFDVYNADAFADDSVNFDISPKGKFWLGDNFSDDKSDCTENDENYDASSGTGLSSLNNQSSVWLNRSKHHDNDTVNMPQSDDVPVILSHGVQRESKMRRVQSVILQGNLYEHTLKDLPVVSFSNDNVVRSKSFSMLNSKLFEDFGCQHALFPPKDICQPSGVTLYIQMQICDSSLQVWLEEKNKQGNLIKDFKDQAFDIYRQLLSALAYIHQKDILHRDLKPRNIFLNGSRPQLLLGDFGLSRPAFSRHSSAVLTPVAEANMTFDDLDEHTSGIGTTSYAAPEQLNQENYDFKADMYSAGIILFELTWPLHTGHERSEYFRKLRQEVLPHEYPLYWKNVATVLQSLISHDPEKRPSAEILLEHTVFSSDQHKHCLNLTEENQRLLAENKALKQENEKLKQKLIQCGRD